MSHPTIRKALAIALIPALAWTSRALHAGSTHPSAIERYGLGGHIQAVGLRHGFHVETVAIDSPADVDQFRSKDVVVKVDGEDIRSLDHLRAALAEAYMDDGEVSITYTRGNSLEQRVAKCRFSPEVAKPATRKRRPARDDVDSPGPGR